MIKLYPDNAQASNSTAQKKIRAKDHLRVVLFLLIIEVILSLIIT